MTTPVLAKIAYLTQPAPDVFLLNFQYGRDPELYQVQISKAQLSGIIIDGASIALRGSRLGPESFTPAIPDAETIEVARAAAVLGEEGP